MARRYRITSQVSVGQNRSCAAVVNRSDVYRADAPGRVNLIGEHTDYNEGLVLPTATPQRTVVELSPREDRVVRVESEGYMPVAYRLGEERHCGDWGDYVRGVTWVLTKAGHPIRGFDAGIASRVPPGAGLSSSAALEVALLRALRAAFSLALDDMALAYAAHKAERDVVGARVGTMDQLAAGLARTGEALLIDMQKSALERVPIPDSVEIVVITSGIAHDNAKQGAYNERRAQCDEAARRLGLASLRDATLGDVERLAPQNAMLARRVRHVVSENERVRAFVAALRAGDLARCGALVDASHASLREDFEVSIPELDALADALRAQRGAHGARLVGAAVDAGADDLILDVATGTGLVAVELARRYGCTVVGLDRSADMLAEAARRNGLISGLVNARAERLPFPDATFDHVTFTYLLRYVDEPAATLSELARVLKPGGRLAALEFGVPSSPWAYALWRVYTRLVMPVAGRLVSRKWREVNAFLGPSIE